MDRILPQVSQSGISERELKKSITATESDISRKMVINLLIIDARAVYVKCRKKKMNETPSRHPKMEHTYVNVKGRDGKCDYITSPTAGDGCDTDTWPGAKENKQKIHRAEWTHERANRPLFLYAGQPSGISERELKKSITATERDISRKMVINLLIMDARVDLRKHHTVHWRKENKLYTACTNNKRKALSNEENVTYPS